MLLLTFGIHLNSSFDIKEITSLHKAIDENQGLSLLMLRGFLHMLTNKMSINLLKLCFLY